MFEALSFSACVKGGSFSSNKDMKKQINEKGVTDLIRQFKASRIRSSILWIAGASKMNPSSLCFICRIVLDEGKQIKEMKVEHY